MSLKKERSILVNAKKLIEVKIKALDILDNTSFDDRMSNIYDYINEIIRGHKSSFKHPVDCTISLDALGILPCEVRLLNDPIVKALISFANKIGIDLALEWEHSTEINRHDNCNNYCEPKSVWLSFDSNTII